MHATFWLTFLTQLTAKKQHLRFQAKPQALDKYNIDSYAWKPLAYCPPMKYPYKGCR